MSNSVRNKYIGKITNPTPSKTSNKITGYKRLNMFYTNNEISFASPTHQTDKRMALAGTAICSMHGDDTLVPHKEGSCGFYSFKQFADAVDYIDGDFVVQLVLSGKFVEHKNGWRSAKQRINGLWLEGLCASCSIRRTARDGEVLAYYNDGSNRLYFLCREHAKEYSKLKNSGQYFLTFSEVNELLQNLAKQTGVQAPDVYYEPNSDFSITRQEIESWMDEKRQGKIHKNIVQELKQEIFALQNQITVLQTMSNQEIDQHKNEI